MLQHGLTDAVDVLRVQSSDVTQSANKACSLRTVDWFGGCLPNVFSWRGCGVFRLLIARRWLQEAVGLSYAKPDDVANPAGPSH